ncbi:MAG: hypothetical protein U1F16_18150 [Turneriella sp.]
MRVYMPWLILALTTSIYADVITKADGTLIEGTVLRVSDQSVEYSTDKLPFLKLDRNTVRKIQYRNGEVVDVSPASAGSNTNIQSTADRTGKEDAVQSRKRRYSKAWVVEFGGSLGYSGYVFSVNRASGSFDSSAIHQVYIAPAISVFIIDQLSIGFLGSFTTIFGQGLSNPSAISGYFYPAYTFDTGGIIFPYLAGLIGYTNSYDSSYTQFSSGGIGYGGRGGVKFAVGSDILIDCGLQYLVQTYSLSYYLYSPIESISIKTFSFNVGISTWL